MKGLAFNAGPCLSEGFKASRTFQAFSSVFFNTSLFDLTLVRVTGKLPRNYWRQAGSGRSSLNGRPFVQTHFLPSCSCFGCPPLLLTD